MELPRNGTSRLAPPWISPAVGLSDRSNKEMIIIPRRRTTTNIVTSGLVLNLDAGDLASYPGIGTTWTDLSGNGNNGTLVNGPTYTSANGGSIIFDGTNDYVNCGNGASINFGTGNMTASVWFKRSNLVTGGRVYTKGGFNSDTITTTLSGFGCRVDTSNAIQGVSPVNQSRISGFPNTAASTIGEWMNAVMVLERNVNIRTFKNATQIGTNTTLVTGSLSGTSPLLLGASTTSATSLFAGEIANFTLYDRALTNDEVLQNFNALRSRYGL